MARVGDDASSPTRLAREFNRRYPGQPVTLHAVRKWLQGEALPAQDKVRVLADWLDVTAEWLRFGDGSKPVLALREPVSVNVDYDLAREVASLSQAHQGVVRALIKALRKSESPGC